MIHSVGQIVTKYGNVLLKRYSPHSSTEENLNCLPTRKSQPDPTRKKRISLQRKMRKLSLPEDYPEDKILLVIYAVLVMPSLLNTKSKLTREKKMD